MRTRPHNSKSEETLLSTFANIINKSFESSCMPAQPKEAIVKPKLKKNNLKFEEYSNLHQFQLSDFFLR